MRENKERESKREREREGSRYGCHCVCEESEGDEGYERGGTSERERERQKERDKEGDMHKRRERGGMSQSLHMYNECHLSRPICINILSYCVRPYTCDNSFHGHDTSISQVIMKCIRREIYQLLNNGINNYDNYASSE